MMFNIRSILYWRSQSGQVVMPCCRICTSLWMSTINSSTNNDSSKSTPPSSAQDNYDQRYEKMRQKVLSAQRSRIPLKTREKMTKYGGWVYSSIMIVAIIILYKIVTIHRVREMYGPEHPTSSLQWLIMRHRGELKQEWLDDLNPPDDEEMGL